MSTNLKPSMRSTNPYLAEIDRVQTQVSTLSTDLNTLEGVVNGLGGGSAIDEHNVLFYDAVGDGVADDTTAILACITANNEMVYFPSGTYRITAPIVFDSKPGMVLVSDGAVILQDVAGTYATGAVVITNSDHFSTQGNLTITSNSVLDILPDVDYSVVTTAHDGLYVGSSEMVHLRNITIKGAFINGVNLQSASNLTGKILDNFVITWCVTGVFFRGEYHTLSNSSVSYCRTGCDIVGGNNSIVSSTLSENRVGAFIHRMAGVGNNDHGKIVGCTVNHNIACGIFIMDTLYSFHVTGCEIWANIGHVTPETQFLPEHLTEAVSVPARSYSYGVYLEDDLNINVTANMIARNLVNLGFDGLVVSAISGNCFISDPARTVAHIRGFGTNNGAYNRNAQFTIVSNSFEQKYKDDATLSVNEKRRIQFFLNTGSTSNDDASIVCRSNVGTTSTNYLIVTGSGGDPITYDPNYEHLLLDLASTKTLVLSSSWAMTNFDIFCYGSGTKTMDIETKATYTGAKSPVIIAPSGVSFASNTWTFSAPGHYRFVAYGADVNQYYVY